MELAEPPAATPPRLPDNVRYLFKPVLTGSALVAAPGDAEVGPGAEGRTAEHASVEYASAPRTSPGNAEASAGVKTRPKPGEPPASEPARRVSKAATAGSHRRSAAAGAGSKLRRRLAGAAAVIVASTAVGTAFALVKHGSAANSPGQQRTGQQRTGQQGAGARQSTRESGWGALRGLSSAGIIRAQAALWVVREVSKSAIIACDDVMCAELLNRGIVASNLLVLSPTAPSPLGADVVIGTPALRSQFGQRLAREYAPTVMASFGIGKSRVDVRVVAPDGAAAYELAQSRDLAARQRYGGVLLRDSRISVAASAQPDFIGGLVDPRLLVMLPVLANLHQIRIMGFYDRAPGSVQGVPLSGAELAGYDAAAGLPADSYLRWLLVFLRGQRVPYRPTSVTTAWVGGHEIVRVQFSRPSPIGFLNGQ